MREGFKQRRPGEEVQKKVSRDGQQKTQNAAGHQRGGPFSVTGGLKSRKGFENGKMPGGLRGKKFEAVKRPGFWGDRGPARALQKKKRGQENRDRGGGGTTEERKIPNRPRIPQNGLKKRGWFKKGALSFKKSPGQIKGGRKKANFKRKNPTGKKG